MSFGGFTGLELARKHPDVVESLFASGCPPFIEGKEQFFASRPNLPYCVNAVTNYAPDFPFNYVWRRMSSIQVSAKLHREGQENFTAQLSRNGFTDILTVTLETIGEIHGVRVTVVAGGKQDNVEVTRRMGRAPREKDPASGCQAFVVRNAIHAWDLQYPELFAEAKHCWVEGNKMPALLEEFK